MAIHILAIGKIKRDGAADLCAEYEKRIPGKIAVTEIDIKDSDAKQLQIKESDALLKALPEGSFTVVLDKKGESLTSAQLAKKMGLWQQKAKHVAFLIGGADGHTESVLKKADFILSFGTMTWPHRLARVMLLEQIYRAHMINANHPYHRE
jgi:23S rRNA (pseudouridine1915-N3)-methyltransferase